MAEPISFIRNQKLRMGLFQREVLVEVVATHGHELWLRLAEPALWLQKHHFERGVDLVFNNNDERHIARSVGILRIDLDKGRIYLRRPIQSSPIQRRHMFREDVKLPVRLIHSHNNQSEESLEAITQDLSGGGLCFETTTDIQLKVGDKLGLELQLPRRKVRTQASVCWAKKDNSGATKVGVQFKDISERAQDWVYGYLFDIQRKRILPTA